MCTFSRINLFTDRFHAMIGVLGLKLHQVFTYNFIGRCDHGLIGLGRFTSCSVRYAAGEFTWFVVSLVKNANNGTFLGCSLLITFVSFWAG